MPELERIVIAGCNGQFGRIFIRKLRSQAVRLVGIDVHDAPAAANLCDEYVRGTIERPDTHLLGCVAEADCTLLCVPEEAVLPGIEALLGVVGPKACVADIASVKSRIAARVAAAGTQAGYVSLHPMFAPTERFAGRNVAVIRMRENAATAQLEALLAGWGARLSVLSAEAHDRLTACVQVMPHAALLALGAALGTGGIDFAATRRIATPVHEAMLSLLARILEGRAEVYWSIQAHNPYAAEARATFIDALTTLDSMARREDGSEFARLVEQVSAYLGAALTDLGRGAERIVEATGHASQGQPPDPS